MRTLLITDRSNPNLMIKDNQVSFVLGDNREVLSGAPVPIPGLVFPLVVSYSNGGTKISAIYDQMARMVNGTQIEMFFVYDTVSGFHWRATSECIPVYPQS